MNIRSSVGTVVTLAAVVIVVGVHAQTPPAGAQGRGGAAGGGRGAPTAPPPIQWSTPAAPTVTLALDTAVQHMIWVVPTRGLTQPWSMAFLPDGGILVTERPGCLRIVHSGVLDPRHVSGLPAIQAAGLGGLMDLALHPRFNENQLVYFTYHKPAATTTVAAIAPTGLCVPVQEGRGRRRGCWPCRQVAAVAGGKPPSRSRADAGMEPG